VAVVTQLQHRSCWRLPKRLFFSVLYMTSTLSDVRSDFRSLKACCCAWPHSQAFFFFSSSLSGCVISAMFGQNFMSWFIIPRNRRWSTMSVGSAVSRIAFTWLDLCRFCKYLGSVPDTMVWSVRTENTHFSRLSVRSLYASRPRTPFGVWSCSRWSRPATSKSSRQQTTPSSPGISWKHSGADGKTSEHLSALWSYEGLQLSTLVTQHDFMKPQVSIKFGVACSFFFLQCWQVLFHLSGWCSVLDVYFRLIA